MWKYIFLLALLPGCLGVTSGDYSTYRVTSDKNISYIIAGRDIRGMAWGYERGLQITSPSDVRALPFFFPDTVINIPGKRWVIEQID